MAETEAITGDRVLALQEKLKNYLAFAKDGQLLAKYPEAKGAPVRIRVDLYAQPDPLALEFLRRFRVLRYGNRWTWSFQYFSKMWRFECGALAA